MEKATSVPVALAKWINLGRAAIWGTARHSEGKPMHLFPQPDLHCVDRVHSWRDASRMPSRVFRRPGLSQNVVVAKILQNPMDQLVDGLKIWRHRKEKTSANPEEQNSDR